MFRLIALFTALTTAAYAQTIPTPGRSYHNPGQTAPVSGLTDILPLFGTKADASRVDALNNSVTGITPLALNPNPAAVGAPCMGNNAQVSVRNSSVTHAATMVGLFGAAGHACDGLQAVLNVTSGATATQTNAVSGYVWNTNPTKSGGAFANGVGVGLNTGAINAVDGAQSWGIAGVIGDVGTGGSIGRTMYNELDFHPGFANTQVVGFILSMDSATQPTNADGWIVGTTVGVVPGAVAKWVNGFRCYDGAVSGTCMTIGLGASVVGGVPASSSSQILGFTFTDGASSEKLATVTATPTGLSVGRIDAVNYNLSASGYMAAGLGHQTGGVTVVRDRQHYWAVPTGTRDRTAFDTSAATASQVAQHLAALIDDLTFHGLIGP